MDLVLHIKASETDKFEQLFPLELYYCVLLPVA